MHGSTLTLENVPPEWFIVHNSSEPRTSLMVMFADYSDRVLLYRDLSIQDKIEYCKLHHYDLLIADKVFDNARHAVWSKLIIIQYALRFHQDYKWIVWMDLDTIIWRPDFSFDDVFGGKNTPDADIFLVQDIGISQPSYPSVNFSSRSFSPQSVFF